MNAPTFTEISYTYKKADADVWVLNFENIPVPHQIATERQIVHLGPGAVGGNHKHVRQEWFVAQGELEFVWLDEDGTQHSEHMNPNGKILLVHVPSYLPHAVRNISETEIGVLMEFADGKNIDVERVQVV